MWVQKECVLEDGGKKFIPYEGNHFRKYGMVNSYILMHKKIRKKLLLHERILNFGNFLYRKNQNSRSGQARYAGGSTLARCTILEVGALSLREMNKEHKNPYTRPHIIMKSPLLV